MTDQARAAYVETVLTEEQRETLDWIQALDEIGSDTLDDVKAIIDRLITYGVECEGEHIAQVDGLLEACSKIADKLTEAEARLTAVRELREELRTHANDDVWSPSYRAALSFAFGKLDRILDDTPTGGTETCRSTLFCPHKDCICPCHIGDAFTKGTP